MKIKFNITTSLAIVSILGFSTVISQELLHYDLQPIVNGLIFVVFGSFFLLAGSVWSTIKWKDGVDNEEIANIMLAVVGFLSILVGVFQLPVTVIQNINVGNFGGIKTAIAIFAIIVISLQVFFKGK